MRIAELGSTKALFYLGVVHYHGLGVRFDCYHPRPRPSRPGACSSAFSRGELRHPHPLEEGRSPRRSSRSSPMAPPSSATRGGRSRGGGGMAACEPLPIPGGAPLSSVVIPARQCRPCRSSPGGRRRGTVSLDGGCSSGFGARSRISAWESESGRGATDRSTKQSSSPALLLACASSLFHGRNATATVPDVQRSGE